MALTIRLTKQEEEKVEILKAKLNIKTSSKVLKFALEKTYEIFK